MGGEGGEGEREGEEGKLLEIVGKMRPGEAKGVKGRVA